jgi:hypothetical protein
MGAKQVTALETNIDNQIALEITPVSVTLIIGQPVPTPTPPAEGE